jgi:formylglycine-generating enzyme required for sulfatase activity
MWSLGIMTAGVMTGKLPYNYNDQTQLLKQFINAQVQIPQLPEPFNAIVRGCLNTNYRQRWTADQVLDALTPKRSIQSPPPVSASSQQRVITSPPGGDRSFTLPNNGGTLAFIAVPGGTLVMEGGHRVNLKPFLMGKYPVTQRQYEAVIGKNPSRFTGDLERPVEWVSWHDAIAFCQKLSQLLGEKIDLPSETQWEWAARGATQSKDYTYAGSNKLDEVGWYWENSGDQRLSGGWDYDKITKNNCRTHPVGQKKSNELGIYDMSGNVWEWCQDSWANNVEQLPQDGTPFTNSDSTRVLRGGSWNLNARICRSANRNRYRNNHSYYNRGFRLILAARTP